MLRFIVWVMARLLVPVAVLKLCIENGRLLESVMLAALFTGVFGLVALHNRQWEFLSQEYEQAYHGYRCVAIVSTSAVQLCLTLLLTKDFGTLVAISAAWIAVIVATLIVLERRDGFSFTEFDIPLIPLPNGEKTR